MSVRVGEEESVKKSECGLSYWLVLPAARKRRERKTGQVCPARKAFVEEGERMLPRRMAWNILIIRKYEFGTKTVKIFLRQTIIWNSFCYSFVPRYLNDLFNHIENTFLNLLYPKSFIHFPKSKALKIHNKNQPWTNARSQSYKTSSPTP